MLDVGYYADGEDAYEMRLTLDDPSPADSLVPSTPSQAKPPVSASDSNSTSKSKKPKPKKRK